MKLLRASEQPGIVQHLKSVLEEAGIECLVRNELTAGLAPEIPLSESTPELWVVRDEQLPQAQRVLAVLASSTTVSGEPWTCSKCGEVSDPQFTSCWKCGAERENAASSS